MSFDQILKSDKPAHIQGVDDHALSAFVAELHHKLDYAPVLVIARDHTHLKELQSELKYMLGSKVYTFPAWDVQPYDRAAPDGEIMAERIATRLRLTTEKKADKQIVVVTTVNALSVKGLPLGFYQGAGLKLKTGQIINPKSLIGTLDKLGYNRVDAVYEPGDFSVRGSLIDFYPPLSENPVRVDFFDDEIDSIKAFDIASQRSEFSLPTVEIVPCSEVLLNNDSQTTFRNTYRSTFVDGQGDSLFKDISENRKNPLMAHYLPFFSKMKLVSLFDELPIGTRIIADHLCDEAAKGRSDIISETFTARSKPVDAKVAEYADIYRPIHPDLMFVTPKEWKQVKEKKAWLHLDAYKTDEQDNGKAEIDIDFDYHTHIDYVKHRNSNAVNVFDKAVEDIKTALKNKFKVLISASSQSALERLESVFAKHDLEGMKQLAGWQEFQEVKSGVSIAATPLAWGYTDNVHKVFVLTEQDLFGEKQNQAVKKKKRKPEDVIHHFSELQVGDFVVHEDHGVGRFEGLETLELAGTKQDLVVLTYDGDDKLLVPVVSLDLLSRYSGAEAGNIKRDKLGGVAWQGRKSRVKKKLLEMAGELIDIAAARELEKGHVYTSIEGMYEEFNAGFPFELTPEQAQAVDDVETDMFSDKPMDRLIVGDVGFGKTEVAMRAAFVAAADGRQVALIVPTTLLVRQHLENFKKRFAGFPIKLAGLSRLNTTKQNTDIKKQMKEGHVDIVIGTHALLAKDIQFKDLGLIIIDEEHRFGVSHKEKLKKLRATVDVLTLTATPIPRTMQMALGGLRTMSTITTPPVDRLAVRTYTMAFDPVIIREAILREIFRDGQVYFVTPRVEGIEKLADFIRELVPESKVRVGHGQMTKQELESVIEDFYDKKFNVLVATTIVESGIDIADANTILVHRADRFGLSQMHQLRGRVGRSKQRAYAYFLMPDKNSMTEEAQKRLRIIQRLEGLGSGFALASYDLDLRGSGNILGSEQSGQVKEVGFELYNQMLKECIEQRQKELQGVAPEEAEAVHYEPVLNLGLTYLIPEEYIPSSKLRMNLYRRLSQLTSIEDIESFRKELIDRFGKAPQDVESLLKVMGYRNRCRALNIAKIDVGPKAVVIAFRENKFARPNQLMHFIMDSRGMISVKPDQRIVFHMPTKGAESVLKVLDHILKTLSEL